MVLFLLLCVKLQPVPTVEADGEDSESVDHDEIDGPDNPPIHVILKNNCILVNVNKQALNERANKICQEIDDRTPLMATVELSDELQEWLRASQRGR